MVIIKLLLIEETTDGDFQDRNLMLIILNYES